jgi:hypothetical protein
MRLNPISNTTSLCCSNISCTVAKCPFR